jgi:hypothetical protein
MWKLAEANSNQAKSAIVDWANETIGDTHIVKRKLMTITKKGKEKNQKECLEVMKRLLVRDTTQNTKNPTIALLPLMMMMEGVEVANTILHNLVVVHSS